MQPRLLHPPTEVTQITEPLQLPEVIDVVLVDLGGVRVIENRLPYERKGSPPATAYRTPIGKAEVVRAGTDVTVVGVSKAVV